MHIEDYKMTKTAYVKSFDDSSSYLNQIIIQHILSIFHFIRYKGRMSLTESRGRNDHQKSKPYYLVRIHFKCCIFYEKKNIQIMMAGSYLPWGCLISEHSKCNILNFLWTTRYKPLHIYFTLEFHQILTKLAKNKKVTLPCMHENDMMIH